MSASTSANTPSLSSSGGPSAANLTTTAPVTWDKVPMADVLECPPGLSGVAFQNLLNCTTRMNGRAMGRISNVKFTLMPKPGHIMAACVAYVPQQAGGANAPKDFHHLASLGGCFLHYSPHSMSLSGSPLFMPGVTDLLKGPTTTILVGGPPHIYVYLEAADLSGAVVIQGFKTFVQITYDLELSGYDHIKGF